MGEWDEKYATQQQMEMIAAFQKEERQAFEEWRRGGPPPERRVLEAKAPKHIYVGNRKQRRAAKAKDPRP